MKVHIKKSQDLMLIRVAMVAVVALLLVLFTSQILRFIGGLIPGDTRAAGITIRLFIILLGASAVLATWLQDRYVNYMLEGDKLIITKGLWGARKQIITLSPSTVSNLDLRQTFLGGMLHYGTIRIEVNNFGGKETYSLKYIDQPQEVFAEIDKHMHALRNQG